LQGFAGLDSLSLQFYIAEIAVTATLQQLMRFLGATSCDLRLGC
jgi:hypothetical protein